MARNIVVVDEESGDEQIVAVVGTPETERLVVATAQSMLEWAGFRAIAEQPMRFQADWGMAIEHGIQQIEVRNGTH